MSVFDTISIVSGVLGIISFIGWVLTAPPDIRTRRTVVGCTVIALFASGLLLYRGIRNPTKSASDVSVQLRGVGNQVDATAAAITNLTKLVHEMQRTLKSNSANESS
jgi:hypothetical protein